MISSIKAAEWVGSLTGLVGSYLLAQNNAHSGYGFVFFLVSNACIFYFGSKTRAWGLVTMQTGFTATSLLGIYHWLA